MTDWQGSRASVIVRSPNNVIVEKHHCKLDVEDVQCPRGSLRLPNVASAQRHTASGTFGCNLVPRYNSDSVQTAK